MKRFKVLFGQRRFQVLVTMAVLLLAVSVIVASGANFTAQKANAGNVFTAGALSMTDDMSPGAILTMTGMVPGSFKDGYVTLENTGTVNGAFSVTKAEVADLDNLGGELQLTVTATDPTTHVDFGAPIYDSTLDGAWSAFGLGTWAPSAPHAYHFHVEWPATGGLDDDTLQGASCEYSFTWDAVSL